MYSSYESIIDLSVSSAMANCRNMTTEQITDLLEDPAKLEALIESLPQVRSLPTDREAALAQNKSLAEWNLGQQPRIEQAKTQTLALLEEANKLKSEVGSLKRTLEELSTSKSLETTHSLALISQQEAEDESEVLLSQYQKGEITLEVFLPQYKQKKTLSHMRKIKADRLNILLREQQGYGTINAANSSGPSYPTNSTGYGAFGTGPGYPNLPTGPQPRTNHPFF